MPEYHEYLAMIEGDPSNQSALGALQEAVSDLDTEDAHSALEATRQSLRERGEIDAVLKLLDVEINAASDKSHRADLLLQKGHLFVDELLNEKSGVECFENVLKLRPGDEDAADTLEHLGLVRDNWQQIVDKYLAEAKASTDRELTTSLYLSIAETYARYRPKAPEVEEFLRKSLEVDQTNQRAANHLERLYRAREQWADLAEHLERRVDAAAKKNERVSALINLAELAIGPLGQRMRAVEAMKKVVNLDPGNARALSLLADAYQADENWSALVMLYTNALKARRRGSGKETEIGMLLQIAMLHWKRLDNVDAAEEFFRRIRKLEPAHPAALEFYRSYYHNPAHADVGHLLQVLRQALKSLAGSEPERRHVLSVEIASLAENELGNPEKAIDAWKAILRSRPDDAHGPQAEQARAALKRLYARTQKWNALLDLTKEEVERLPEGDIAGRVAGLTAVVDIYRDQLKLDVMVINTYNSILTLDPDNGEALDALAEKYEELSRWNDLVSVLTRKAASASRSNEERSGIYQRIASLWIDRFGNYAQAVKPLELILELTGPVAAGAVAAAQLKDIYTRRRQWRALISLLGHEAESLTAPDRREHLSEMARLASERLGDNKLAIELWNRVLELPGSVADAGSAAPDLPLVLSSLAHLYEREKRYLALADIYRRQRLLATTPEDAVPVLERLGSLFADRLHAPSQAASAYRDILSLDPGHTKASRQLRELYAAAGDFDSLEEVYGSLGQWGELVEALHAVADRSGDRAQRLELLQRAARIASAHVDHRERVARAYERILAADPENIDAAVALAPIYRETRRWARLLATYEVLLRHAKREDNRPEQLRFLREIRLLCEHELGSKAQAFEWAARAWKLAPDDDALLADLERLGAEADAWQEVTDILGARAAAAETSDVERLRLFRELGSIASVRLHKPDRAVEYLRKVIELAPDDPAAMDALEEIASQQADWPELLRIYRRRAAIEGERSRRLDLLFKIAFIEEERLADHDGAVNTYKKILEVDPESRRALKALAKLHEAGGDWSGVALALEGELDLAADADTRVSLHLRIGTLYEKSLNRRADALSHYKRALDAGSSSLVYAALEPFLDDDIASVRGDVARLLLPAYEQAGDKVRIALCLECLRSVAKDSEKVSWDRRLLQLYNGPLKRRRDAFEAGLRIARVDPGDHETRAILVAIADEEGLLPALAAVYRDRLEALGAKGKEAVLRLQLATELAEIVDERLEDSAQAEVAWTTVLELDPSSRAAYDALDRLYRNAEDWGSLRQVLIERVENSAAAEDKLETLAALCELTESILGDTDGAIRGYSQILEIDPDHMGAYKALERLYADRESWVELEQILAREAGSVADDDERAQLLLRRAMLRSQFLGQTDGAVDLVEDLLSLAPTHPGARDLLEDLVSRADVRLRVARILEPLYGEDGSWLQLARVLAAQAEFSTNDEQVELFARIAEIEEVRLGDATASMAAWKRVLEVDPSDLRARENLLRFAVESGEFAEIADALARAEAAAEPGNIALRTELGRAVAEIYDHRIGDPIRATQAYRRLYETDPESPQSALPAVIALSRLYEQARAWDLLPAMLRRRAEWTSSSAERCELLTRIAEIEQHEVGDRDAAVAAWRDVLAEDANDLGALYALAALYREGDQPAELAEILRRRVDAAETAERKVEELRELAALWEAELENRDEAIAAHLEILDHTPNDARTLIGLARLYREADRHVDLLEVIERRLPITSEPEARAALMLEEAQILESHLGRNLEALERYGDVLGIDPAHPGALAHLEEMLGDDTAAVRASEILEPLFEANAEHAKLAALLERRSDLDSDPRRVIADRTAAARVRELDLRDLDGAFASYARAARASLTEPDLPGILAHLERLAAARGAMGELVVVYRAIAPDVLDGDLQRRLFLDIADLSRATGDLNTARDHYRKVLDAQPDDARALAALESLYRDADEPSLLYDILVRRAELLPVDSADIEVRTRLLAEAAMVAGSNLKRPEDAIVLWEQILELNPGHRDAAESLELLYRTQERWHEVAAVLERRLGYAMTTAEAVEQRLELGRLFEKQIGDPEAAFESYTAALAGDPSSSEARAHLERYLDEPGLAAQAANLLESVYVTTQDWPKLVRIYEIKLDASSDPDERLRLTRYIARLYEDQLGDMEGAFRWYGKVFREDPRDRNIRDQLVRLANILESWERLAHVYQEFLDDEPGDRPDIRDVALELARIYDYRLGEIDRGQVAYRRVLEADPDNLPTFEALESMLTRGERWYALCDCYEEAVHATLDDARRQELYVRLARVQETRLEDHNRAIDAYQAVLNINGENQVAVESLNRLYKDQEKWTELAELLRAQIESADAPAARAENRARLAEVLETRLNEMHGAIDQYELMLADGATATALAALERLVQEEPYRERVAFMLEPVYRLNDWWQKLVVILEAKLPYISDPVRRVEVLREIADIHESRGGDERLALAALARAWHEDVSSYQVYEALGALAARLGAFGELIAALEKGIEDQYDFELVGRVLSRIAEIRESQFGDPQAAIAVWRRYLEIEEDNRAALAALDRLLADAGRYGELGQVLGRRAELAEDPSIRQVLFRRLAAVQEEHLDSRADAIAAYKSVLAVDPADRTSLDALERLYRSERDFTELSDILGRKIEVCEDASERRTLRFALALVFKTHLADNYEAVAQMLAVLADDPTDAEALGELDTLYAADSMWVELLDVIDKRAHIATAPTARADLEFRAAKLIETELLEPIRAIERLAAVLATDPGHPGARSSLDHMTDNEDTLEPAAEVLERVYRAENAHRELAALLEKRLRAQAPDPAERGSLYGALAELHEVSRGDLDAAFAVWARALAERSGDESIWGQLERLAGDRGAWEDLASLYERQLADTVDTDLEYRYAVKLADVYEQALGDLERSAAKHRVALETGVDEPSSLDSLARLYERSSKPAELVEILGLQAEAASSEEMQSELLFRIGDVYETQLADIGGAIGAYRDVLERDRGHAAARSALDRMLVSHIEPGAVIGILEPIYETEGEAEKLCQLLAIKLGLTQDTLDRAQIYARIAELAETRLDDPTRALDAAGGWLAEDPGSEEALTQLERLAEVGGRWSEVAARLQGIVDSSESRDVAASLLPHLGAVQLDRLGDLTAASLTFVKVRERDPDSPVALLALERIYRQQNNAARLAETLVCRARAAFDVGEKRAAHAEAGALYESLGDDASGERCWKEVLDLDESDREAHGRLAVIFDRASRIEELIEILGVSARFATDMSEERAIRARIATLLDTGLGDLDRSIDAWRAALDADPADLAIMNSLESVLSRNEDWAGVVELLRRRADITPEPAQQVEVHRRMASVQEQRLESPDEAIATLQGALEIDGANAAAHADLERLLTKNERWHDLVELYVGAAELSGTLGNRDIEVRYLAAAADVWEDKLENPEAAGEILEKILAREPNYVPALTRLAKIYERAGDWDKCSEVLERAIGLGPTGTDAAELQFRLGEVELARAGDVNKAQICYRQALEYDSAYEPAITALAGHARENEDWTLYADMLGRRYQAMPPSEDRQQLVVELADVYNARLGQPQAMISVLEEEARLAPESSEVLSALADAYFGSGRNDDAAPIYSKLGDAAKKARKMKDVARYRQKAAELFEVQGLTEEALAAYEEAFRIDPTNAATMAGLGRIYLGAEEWEKARRVYRSMVLSNIEPGLGITKADVYYNLGYIHAQLGEINKAKGMMQRGLEIDPTHERIKQAMASL